MEYDVCRVNDEGNIIENTSAKLVFNASSSYMYPGFLFETSQNPEYSINPFFRGVSPGLQILILLADRYCEKKIRNGVNNCDGCATVSRCDVNCDPNPC